MTHAYSNPRLDSTSSGTSWIDDRLGGGFGDAAQELLADRGVRDRFELLAGRVVDEGDGRELRPVERAVGVEDAGAEAPDELRERRRPGLDDLTRDPVGVDDDRAPVCEHRRDGRLPRADPARQPDHQHDARILRTVDSVAELAGKAARHAEFTANCWQEKRRLVPKFLPTRAERGYASGSGTVSGSGSAAAAGSASATSAGAAAISGSADASTAAAGASASPSGFGAPPSAPSSPSV